MSQYEIDKQSTRTELDDLIRFVTTLVIKDEDAAEAAETLDSAKAAFEYIAAMLGTDNNDVTTRQQIIDSYVETNPYYVYLEQTYGISAFFARQCKDFAIMQYDQTVLSTVLSTNFLELYYGSVRYFTTVLYTKAFVGQNLYRNFCRLAIVVMTMERYISSKMENAANIDLFDSYSISNMLASYGLDIFSDLPEKYQTRILKNINSLLTYKGTDKVIVDIIGLFGFENINVFKYYLVRDYQIGSNGKKDWSQPFLKFMRIPINSTNIEGDLANADSVDFSQMVNGDPYWQATEQEVLQQNFSFVNTKYIGIESAMDLLQETQDMSYLLNILFQIEKKWEGRDNLYAINTSLSDLPTKLIDLIIALQITVVKNMGYVDNIMAQPSQIAYVYGYNFDQFVSAQNYIASKIPSDYFLAGTPDGSEHSYDDSTFISQFSIPANQMNSYDVGTTINSLISPDNVSGYVDKNYLINMFLGNNTYRQALENLAINAGDYKTFRMIQEMWNLKFTTDFMNSNFSGYDTYSDYLKNSNEGLYNSIQVPIGQDPSTFYEQMVITLCDTIDRYLNDSRMDMFMKNDTLATGYIKNYLYRLLNVFKAYTVDVNDLSIIYRFDSKFFSTVRLFDDSVWKINIRPIDEEVMIDEDHSWVNSSSTTTMDLMAVYDPSGNPISGIADKGVIEPIEYSQNDTLNALIDKEQNISVNTVDNETLNVTESDIITSNFPIQDSDDTIKVTESQTWTFPLIDYTIQEIIALAWSQDQASNFIVADPYLPLSDNNTASPTVNPQFSENIKMVTDASGNPISGMYDTYKITVSG
jgi:hypothetical protein